MCRWPPKGLLQVSAHMAMNWHFLRRCPSSSLRPDKIQSVPPRRYPRGSPQGFSMTTPKGANDPIDPKLVRKLADILRETELSEIEVEQGELKIRVARQLTAAPAIAYTAAPLPVAAPSPQGSPLSVPAPSPTSEAPAAAAAPKDAI